MTDTPIYVGKKTGWLIVLASLISDQASKLIVLFASSIPQSGSVSITSFFDLVLVWNHGISYGLFQQESQRGRWILVSIAAVMSVGLMVWLSKCQSQFRRIAIALVLGGAIGNLFDRAIYGAVVDFLHFHMGHYSWYVFNLADCWIVIGASMLIIEGFFEKKQRA